MRGEGDGEQKKKKKKKNKNKNILTSFKTRNPRHQSTGETEAMYFHKSIAKTSVYTERPTEMKRAKSFKECRLL